MSDSPQIPAAAPSPALSAVSPADRGLDQLAHLHRMSRTAGLGSSEYAAVSVAAVVAVLIGAASALALITPVFLFLPVLGTVIALVAIRKIRSSNGTQTGLALAVLALVLSFGLTAFTGVKALASTVRERADVRDLDQLTLDFGQDLAAKRYAEAYAKTDPRFRDQVTAQRFEGLFTELDRAPTVGAIKSAATPKSGGRGLFTIDTDPETGLRMATSKMTMETEKRTGESAIPLDVTYRYDGTAWHIYSIPQLPFNPPAAAGGGAPPAGASGPPQPRQ